MMEKYCTINDCTRNAWARGYCSTHYSRWRRNGDPLKVLPKHTAGPIKERLAKRSCPEPNTGCLLWFGVTNNKGYGIIYYQGKHTLTHRLSWSLANGPIPKGLFVLHKCDTPPCINPEHLFLGTQKDNIRDAVRKGRFNTADKNGRNNPNTNLTNADVLAIREGNKTTSEFSKQYGIKNVAIRRIQRRITWRHI